MWNVITVRPRYELDAAARLSSLGVVVFLPQASITVRRNRSRARCQITQPIFRGYLFAESGDKLWALLHQISAINGFLRRADGGPAVLSDAAIEAVREMAAMANAAPAKQWPFQVGDKVRVAGNRNTPFHGVIGILQRLDRKDRATLELIVNHRAKVTIPAARLELAE